MAFSLPTFNLTVWIFRHGNAPPGAGPDVIANGNLTPGRRVFMANAPAGFGGCPMLVEVLLPALTDIRGWNDPGASDWAEVPAGSGRYYEVLFVDDIGKGFANEHRFALLAQINPWPSPIP